MKRAFLFIAILISLFWLSSNSLFGSDAETSARRPPNIVIVFTDDQGYSDLGCFGSVGFKTPAIDRLAQEGCRITNFEVPESSCSPSRAALLTGCYPLRVHVGDVLFPTTSKDPALRGYGKIGLHPDETTIADLLKQKQYATACIGKWHLGDAPEFLPVKQGFDLFFGFPYSHDMWRGNYPPLPLYDARSESPDGQDLSARVIETDPDFRFITKRYTEKAVDFINENKERPFFLYLAHSMPHVPLAASPEFQGASEHGLYGDVIQEIDWSVGQVTKAIQDNGLDENTLIVFASDNGPWLSFGNHGGHCDPLRQGKGTRYEGGHRTPCVMRWTGTIPAHQTLNQMIGSIDLFPTIARITGTKIPNDRIIDGIDQLDYITGASETSARNVFFYQTQAVREGDWKLYAPGKYREYPETERKYYITVDHPEYRLYNLKDDISEKRNLAAEYPDKVKEMTQKLDAFRTDLRDNSRQPGVYKPAPSQRR